LMALRRPAEWNEWSEAVWRDARAPRFIGDMPHGWVMSDFIRATLDMLAYERESDSTLVVGAGVPIAWARDPAGITVRGLRTRWGALELTSRPSGRHVRMTLRGVTPPGGIELRAPYGALPQAVFVDGVRTPTTDGGRAVRLRAPAIVELDY